MLPPSWLTALCGPAAPIPTCSCCSSAPPRSPTRSSPPSTRRRAHRVDGARGRAAPSAWPTRRQRGSRADTTDRARPWPRWPPGAADAVVSAGATGATVTAAVLGLGRWPGVRRPALAAILPAVAGPVVLLDVGGSLEASPATWSSTPRSGAAYAAVVARRRRAPGRPALRRLGAGKGDRLRRAADAVLRRTHAAAPAPATSAWSRATTWSPAPRADVVVTDGFTGNVLLKGMEAARTPLAGRPAGGGRAPRAAALLGVAGTVVVCHGAADRRGRRLRHRAGRPPAPPRRGRAHRRPLASASVRRRRARHRTR